MNTCIRLQDLLSCAGIKCFFLPFLSQQKQKPLHHHHLIHRRSPPPSNYTPQLITALAQMQQRNSGNRRPSGTDGSDFSYRMVVDNRYTKVAKGKSTLSKVLVIQAVVVVLGVFDILFTLLKKEPLEILAAASISLTLIAIIIGELGRKRSRVSFLKFYMAASSIGILGSIASGIELKASTPLVGLSNWETDKFDLLKIACVSVGLFVQIFSISKTTSLIGNMSPPKRAS
ncbi:unnamed protein product [Lactuca virosa]|uniref:Magnesium transporter n=1 Tax=Lactuca virosa TaxID=75947 RepID=A0AAU9NBM7_9ASTR|nr:unnamed protein product [Lactuca virosa]